VLMGRVYRKRNDSSEAKMPAFGSEFPASEEKFREFRLVSDSVRCREINQNTR
jgi:hypothetical protein